MKTLLTTGEPPTAGPEAWIGKLIDGRYRVLDLLGEGGMGAVFVAEHTGLGKRVALKLVRPEFAEDPDFVDRFHREAMATARLDHPNIAKAIDYGTLDNGDAYLVMQLVSGRGLEDVIAKGERLGWREVCAIGAQISGALAAAHEIGIVHRDLKPDNVMIVGLGRGNPRVKVLDFGIARIQDVAALGVPARDLTRQGSIIGTPGYMSPEQACGDVAAPRCDLYALGVILWELLAGRPLWTGETLTDLFTAQLSEDPGPPPTPEGPLPAALEVLIMQLLDREPTRRPASARDLEEVFLEFARAPEASLQGAPVEPSSASPRRGSAHRWRLFAAAAVVAVAVVVAVGLVLSGSEEAPAAGQGAAVSGEGAAEEVPSELRDAAETLARSEARAERRSAAQAVLAHEPDGSVPPYLRTLAELASEESCEARAEGVEALGRGGDKRALPALETLVEMSRALCKRSDPECLACLRTPLGDAIRELQGDDG